jgi:hypothetical protein
MLICDPELLWHDLGALDVALDKQLLSACNHAPQDAKTNMNNQLAQKITSLTIED